MASVTKDQLLQAVATASAGYFAGNPTPPEKIEAVVQLFFRVLAQGSGSNLVSLANPPAVPIDQSVKDDQVICLECGKGARSLRPHLRAAHGLTPDEYRIKWALKDTYPMMAPLASEIRSAASKEIQARVQADPSVNKGGRHRRARPA